MIWPFKSRRVAPAPPFCVWMDHQARAAGMVRAILNDAAEHVGVVLVVHFSATAAWWTEQLDAVHLDWTLLDTPTPGPAILDGLRHAPTGGPGRVFLLHSEQVPGEAESPPVSDADAAVAARLRWHVAEAHCLPGRAERVDALAAGLGSPPPTHHASLDDPLMQMFGGEKTKALMQKLGMTDGEPIASPMVSRSVVKAQAKIAERVGPTPQPAESQAAWIERNLTAAG